MNWTTKEELKRHYDEISQRLWSGGGRAVEEPPQRVTPVTIQPVVTAVTAAAHEPISNLITFRPLPNASPRINFHDVIDLVSGELQIPPSMMFARRRDLKIVSARHLAWALAREKCLHLSLPIIGRVSGDYDHSTVLHGARNGVKHEAFDRLAKRLDDVLAERLAARAEDESNGSV